MRNRSRHVLSIATSTIAHVAVLLTGLFDLSPDALDVDIDLEFELVEVDLVDPDMLQGEDKSAEPIEIPPAPTLPPPPEAPPEPEAEKEQPKEPEEPTDEGPKRDLGQKRSKVDQLGPPNSTFHVLLSTRNIKKLKFRKLAMAVVAPLPDYDFLVTGGGFDPFKDFDHILIASPDLRSVTQTFLAVDYKLPRDVVKAKIEKAVAADGQTIKWKEENGILRGNPKPKGQKDWDPRWFVLPQEKVALYVRKEFLGAATKEEAGEEKTTANFVTKLTKLKRYARRIPTAGLQFEAHDLHSALKTKSAGKFQLPDDIELTIEAQNDPEINMYWKFAGVLQAKQFESWYKDDVGELVRSNLEWRFLAGSLYDAFEVTRTGKEVQFWAELERKQTEIILKTIGAKVADFEKGAEKRRAAQRKKLRDKAANESDGDKAAPDKGK